MNLDFADKLGFKSILNNNFGVNPINKIEIMI